MRWNREPVLQTLTVHLRIQFVLSLAFANVRAISLVTLNAGREVKTREKQKQMLMIKKQEKKEVATKEQVQETRDLVPQTQIVRPPTLFAPNLGSANVKATNQEIRSAGREVKGGQGEEMQLNPERIQGQETQGVLQVINRETQEVVKDKGLVHLMQTVRLQILSALSLAFANVRVTSQVTQNAGREARTKLETVQVEKLEDLEENKDRAPLTPTVQLLTRSVLSSASASAQVTSRVTLSAGREVKTEKKEEEVVLQTQIVQLPTQCALSSDSASAVVTSLEMRSAGAEERRCAQTVAMEVVGRTQVAPLVPIGHNKNNIFG